MGAYVDRFEEQLRMLTGASSAIAVVNGTAALHTCLRLVGVGAGDEVLIPTLTFIATANAVSYQGAVPHFVDSDPGRLAVDADKLERHLQTIADVRETGTFNRNTKRRLAAIVAMHVFGHPADMDRLQAIADHYRIPLVEDAAESLGSTYNTRHTGTFGAVAALSFNGNKIATCGGGGAVLTMDPELGARAKHLTTTARISAGWEFVHDDIGYNYRMPNLNAALGCAQLEQLPDFVVRKRQLAQRYHDVFDNHLELATVREPPDSKSNYWLNAVLTPDRASRDAVLKLTNEAGFMTRPCWTLMHQLPLYAHCPQDQLTNACDLVKRIVNLPSSPRLVGDSG